MALSRHPTARLLLAVAAVWLTGGLAPAVAGPNEEPPWARAIRDGIVEQDRELARSTPQAVLLRYESRVGRDPDVTTLYLLARAYGKKPDVPSALTTYAEVIKAEAGCWFAWRDRGVLKALQRDGKGQIVDAAGAEADLRRAVSLKPDYVDALQPLALLYLDAKRWDDAIALLQRVLDADPARESARVQIIAAQRAAKRPDDALRTLQPLLSKSPSDASYRYLQGMILQDKREWKSAQAIFKQLILDNPTAEAPLRAWVGVAESSKEMDRDEGVWVLERLLRLVKSEDERKRLSAAIQRLRAAPAPGTTAPTSPTGPPTPQQLATVLRGSDPAGRTAVLRLLAEHPKYFKEVGRDLVLALIERLDDRREPDPMNRYRAVAIFGHLPVDEGGASIGRQYGALLRDLLREKESPEVRAKTADVLAEIGALSEVPALEIHARGKDASVAAASRAAIYQLAKAVRPNTDETPEAQAAAFKEWWASPERVAFKITIVQEILASAQLTPEAMLLPLFFHETDPRVWGQAYRALHVISSDIAKAFEKAPPSPGKARGDWMRAFPSIPDADLSTERRAAAIEAVVSWYEKKPGP